MSLTASLRQKLRRARKKIFGSEEASENPFADQPLNYGYSSTVVESNRPPTPAIGSFRNSLNRRSRIPAYEILRHSIFDSNSPNDTGESSQPKRSNLKTRYSEISDTVGHSGIFNFSSDAARNVHSPRRALSGGSAGASDSDSSAAGAFSLSSRAARNVHSRKLIVPRRSLSGDSGTSTDSDIHFTGRFMLSSRAARNIFYRGRSPSPSSSKSAKGAGSGKQSAAKTSNGSHAGKDDDSVVSIENGDKIQPSDLWKQYLHVLTEEPGEDEPGIIPAHDGAYSDDGGRRRLKGKLYKRVIPREWKDFDLDLQRQVIEVYAAGKPLWTKEQLLELEAELRPMFTNEEMRALLGHDEVPDGGERVKRLPGVSGTESRNVSTGSQAPLLRREMEALVGKDEIPPGFVDRTTDGKKKVTIFEAGVGPLPETRGPTPPPLPSIILPAYVGDDHQFEKQQGYVSTNSPWSTKV
ncbi:hypothetical protein F4779DRAFT_481143 [Xylariaceae sp. FL0662B]|nr:hypothetical protein F4779DRAFT_481143 [Xylariaceae sp. FL0662B]